MTVPTGEQALKLEEKRNQFLALVRRTPGISRQECARTMRVSTFYASRLVPELITAGMVLEAENTEPAVGRGRPSKPLYINSEYGYFAGIDLQAEYWRFVIIDFQGNPRYSFCKRYEKCGSREEHIEQLGNLLNEATQDCETLWSKVVAVGIGVPTIFDKGSGLIEDYDAIENFNNIPMLDVYRMASSKPVYVSQGIFNLATFDSWKQPAKQKKTVLLASQHAGVSSALLEKGRVIVGSGMMGGQIGRCYSSTSGKMLEDICGLKGLRKALQDLPEEFWEGDQAAVKDALRKPNTKKKLYAAMDDFASALVNLSAFCAPDELIMVSKLLNGENALWDYFVAKVKELRSAQNLPELPVKPTANSDFNGAVGAGLFALENVFPICE